MHISRGRTLAVLAVVVPVVVALALWVGLPTGPRRHRDIVAPAKPEAPPDLEKLRTPFSNGLDALARKDGGDAVKHFSSFSFGRRAVEEYRLWFLAQGHQLAKDDPGARVTLAQLWARGPQG